MPFTGTYEHTIDAKNRLSIPSAIRNAMDKDRDGEFFYVVPGRSDGTISLVGNRRFEEFAQSRSRNLLSIGDDLDFDRLYFADSYPLEFDKQGRVLLPEQVLLEAGITREVTIIGSNDYVDIWDRERFREYREKNRTRRQELRTSAARGQPRPTTGP